MVLLGCGESTAPPPGPGSESDAGATSYGNYCAACHHPEGLGVAGGGPPLLGSPWVTGPEGRLVRIVLDGVRGPITVGDATYRLEMPGFGPVLTDLQVASLLSHVRARFGASSAPITPAAVGRVRAETRGRNAYWTAEELLDLPP